MAMGSIIWMYLCIHLSIEILPAQQFVHWSRNNKAIRSKTFVVATAVYCFPSQFKLDIQISSTKPLHVSALVC